MKSFSTQRLGILNIILMAGLLGNLGALAFSIYHNRVVYWFPDYILGALRLGFTYDFPNISFVIFQLPTYFLYLINPLSPENIDTRLNILSIMLSVPVPLALVVCWWIAKRLENRSLWLFPLFGFAVLYQPSSAASFSGALHGFGFFWLLVFSQLFRWEKGDPRNKLFRASWILLFIAFYFCYPPFSFFGSLYFALFEFFKARERKIQVQPEFYLMLFATLVSFAFLSVLTFLPIWKTYGETMEAFGKSLSSGSLVHVSLCLGACLSLMVIQPKNRSLKWLPWALFLGAFVWWPGWVVLSDHPERILKSHHDHRIYIYTGSFALAILMTFRKKFDFPYWNLNFKKMVAISLLFSCLYDLSSTKVFAAALNRIFLEAKTSAPGCVRTGFNGYDFGVFEVEYPVYSFLFWNRYAQSRIFFYSGDVDYSTYPRDLSVCDEYTAGEWLNHAGKIFKEQSVKYARSPMILFD